MVVNRGGDGSLKGGREREGVPRYAERRVSRPNPDTPTDASRVASSSDDRAFAASALRAEAQAIERIQLDERFDAAVGMILAALDGGGSVVVSGSGSP